MKERITIRFVLVFILVTLTSFILTSYVSSNLTYEHQINTETSNLYEEASYLSTQIGINYYNWSMTLEEIKAICSTVDSYLDCSVLMIDRDGKILIDTNNTNEGQIINFDPTQAGSSNRFMDNFYGLYQTEQLTVFYPITYYGQVRAYMAVSKPIEFIKTEADSIFNYNYITMLFTLILTLLALSLLLADILHPIKKITKLTENYAKGDFSKKINLKRSDEIGRLADSLDYMGSEINSFNEYQRKFIANVSHDFRSPLTSIKGYLIAMQDGTIPPELYDKYFGIVITETERLTKLTNNLLAINNFNDQGMVLDLSDFDICDMIKHTIETFEGVCTKKNLKFKLIFTDKQLFVNADYSKIQQVLYNLIDNAIKFSNNDSSIIISVSEKNDRILTSVKDFGIGIPRDSVGKIWERFYKTDLSRGKDKKGTGLGLAIVKDIINAHKEYIDVVSTEGVGTEFTFALPKSKNGTR